MRRLLSWSLYHVGYVLLVLSERTQGEGEGPWGEALFPITGNQFVDADFTPDG